MRRKNIFERRKTQRLKITLRLEYRFLPRRKALIEKLFTQDVSGGGIGLRLRQPLKKGMRLKTLLYFPLDRRPVSTISEVVRCKKRLRQKKTYFDVGIKHLKVIAKDKERFVYLFCETMINYFVLPAKISTYERKNV